MCELIRLAKMPKGNPYKKLTVHQKNYIIDNHIYEPIETMANALQIRYQDVEIFCRSNRYSTPKKKLLKPKKKAKEHIFDIDNYLTYTI
jgi:DUF1365 family protein